MSSRGIAQVRVLQLLTVWLVLTVATPAIADTWTPVTNLPPNLASITQIVLLPDGTILAQNTGDTWQRLSPSTTGSYVAGTWSNIAKMGTARLYYTSHILRNLKMWILGGEYSGPNLTANWTATGEVYDIVTDTWSPIAPYPGPGPGFSCPGGAAQCFGDDPSMLLPGDRIIAGDLISRTPQVYDIATNTWSLSGPKVYNESSDEESWARLQSGHILNYDLFRSVATGGSYAEKYIPASNSWVSVSPSDGTALGTIPLLSSPAMGFELGPMLRLQDGRVLVIGATPRTALYDEATNTWAAGPEIRSADGATFGATDAPGAVLPNGHVLFFADASPQFTTPFHAPTKAFDFNPFTNTISEVTVPAGSLAASLARSPSYVTRMLVLPTGQVLVCDGSRQLWVYSPDGVANPLLRPVVTAVTYSGGGRFQLTGKQLNGQNAGSNYGDESSIDENFPVVRLRSTTGLMFYARTSNWSSVGVATGASPETVDFTLPPSLATPGNYQLQVVGAGIGGLPITIAITAAQIAGM